ncbi:hypothetical protein KIH74_22665 [Kineosporia sp. J2-2]|uniref:Uncharacterized protein n=1 Tax=Kineosporia corallincola TaxID=2835133 RepID=A0ABS5TNI6_9ACTN|nr:hypothetical protein [Kineosporia corallincola]MBT0771761.1 hypothetical protein [Kineosporia corallincola]
MATLHGGPADGALIPDRGLPVEHVRVVAGKVILDDDGFPLRLPVDPTEADLVITRTPLRTGWRSYRREADGSYRYVQWRGPVPR